MAQRTDSLPLIWFGLIGALLVALLAMFADHRASVWGIQSGLKSKVEQALADAGLDGVAVTMDGQRAVLSGVTGSAEDRAKAETVALRAAGSGGAWAGGVTSVSVEDVVPGAPVSPFTWQATRMGESLHLTGHVPTARAREALRARAKAAFPRGEIDDDTVLAAGAPGGDWAGIAGDAIEQIAKLNRGEARLVDSQLVILGEGEAAAVEAMRQHYGEGVPQPFRARFEVTAAGQRLAIPELGDLDISSGEPAACQTAFARIMQDGVINFRSGSAEIEGQASFTLLSNLASIALRCDQSRIVISGHTDNVGSVELNRTVSQARADAVLRYLAAQGVRMDRLTAEGRGPDQPRASNATPAGQAANRRIEFEVRRETPR
jgi:outer membrane protein OmpA-like peptidoglycan-associated protein